MSIRAWGSRGRAARESRGGGEHGFAAIEFVAAVAFFLVPTVMIITTLGTWFESRQSAESIARELAHGISDSTLGCTLTETDVPNIRSGARLLAAERGIAPSSVHVDMNQPRRGATVHVTVGIDVPAAQVPFTGTIGSFRISMDAQAPVDPYRDCSQ